MKLNMQTDYALRVLMALAKEPDRLRSVDDIAKVHGISRNHLAKVAQDLVAHGFVSTVRGRNGGMRLAMPVTSITVGAVVRAIESDLGVVECLQSGSASCCAFLPSCRLKRALSDATAKFLNHLDSVTVNQL